MWDFGAPPLARTLLTLVKAELRKTKKILTNDMPISDLEKDNV